ncbi:MAG TPA: hypothetical protein VGM86_30675 [Thermoanaerobaculia bacterium]|jgi:dolichol kinase
MKSGTLIVLIAVIMTIFTTLWLQSEAHHLPDGQVAVVFVCWLFVGAGSAAAIGRRRKRRQMTEKSSTKAEPGAKGGS